MHRNLTYLPERSKKERKNGITIVTDYGLTPEDTGNLLRQNSQFIDLVKFHTSLFVGNEIKEKISTLKNAGIQPFYSGTLFEAFYVRGQIGPYIDYLKDLGLTTIEISDSIIEIEPFEKLALISKLAKEFTVISEVGPKHADVVFTYDEWKNQIIDELSAGAWKVIIEGGVNGDSGVFESTTEPKPGLIQSLLTLDQDKIIWETKHASQQEWFINKIGANVNLSNIEARDILNLESIRLGLHPYTFFNHIPESIKSNYIKKVSPFANIDFQI